MIALDLPRERKLALGEKPLIMGILNLTSDSFFPQSRIPDMTLLVERAKKMIEEGADMFDVGAEST